MATLEDAREIACEWLEMDVDRESLLRLANDEGVQFESGEESDVFFEMLERMITHALWGAQMSILNKTSSAHETASWRLLKRA